MKDRICDNCKEPTQKKFLGKIRGKFYCKKCRNKIRKKHREETIEMDGIKPELNRLKQKINKERGYGRKCYEKRVGHKVGEKNYLPTIKGSQFAKPRERNYCSITNQEKSLLYSSLIKRGLNSIEANERIKSLMESQEELRITLKKNKKSEKEIKIKQRELLEELWNY